MTSKYKYYKDTSYIDSNNNKVFNIECSIYNRFDPRRLWAVLRKTLIAFIAGKTVSVVCNIEWYGHIRCVKKDALLKGNLYLGPEKQLTIDLDGEILK